MKLLTREQIIDIVTRIKNCDYPNEEETDKAIEELQKGVIDPKITDYVFWEELTSEEIADKTLSYQPILL